MSPQGVILATYPVSPVQITHGFVKGPDGAVWFVAEYTGSTGSIGRITTDGQISYFPMPATSYAGWKQNPLDLVVGADGNIWFVDEVPVGTSKLPAVTRVTVPTGQMTTFTYNNAPNPGMFGGHIAVGNTVNGAGTFWAIGGQKDASGHPDITEFDTNGNFLGSYPAANEDLQGSGNILFGSDWNVWFSSDANINDRQSKPTYINQLVIH